MFPDWNQNAAAALTRKLRAAINNDAANLAELLTLRDEAQTNRPHYVTAPSANESRPKQSGIDAELTAFETALKHLENRVRYLKGEGLAVAELSNKLPGQLFAVVKGDRKRVTQLHLDRNRPYVVVEGVEGKNAYLLDETQMQQDQVAIYEIWW